MINNNQTKNYAKNVWQNDQTINLDLRSKRKRSVLQTNKRLFCADLKDEKIITDRFNEILDEETEFNITVFLEIAFYHFVFFAILGPFTPLIMFLKFRNLILARNLKFIGISFHYFFQTFVYLLNFIGIFGSLFLDSPLISRYETYFLIGGLLVRALIISIKYAFFGEKKIL